MTIQSQTPDTEQNAPLFPPSYLLILAGLGFALAFFVLISRREFDMVGWGGLGVGVISLIAWALMAPDQLMNFLRGRALAYGGTAILATVVFLAALVLVYLVVQKANIRMDVTDNQLLSLSPEAEEIIGIIANDPTVPPLQILGFFTPAQADQYSLLFEDIGRASNQKITYQIQDADREPLLAETYEAQNGMVFIIPQNADGTLQTDKKQQVTSLAQQTIVEAIISASSTGDFRAYFLDLRDSVDFTSPEQDGGQILTQELKDRYNWNVQVVTLNDLTRQGTEIVLNDPAANGEVLIISGGESALTDEQTKFITDYLDKGGNLVLLAGQNLSGETASLATTPALSTYLFEKFGLRFYNDLVLDPEYSLQGISSLPLAAAFDTTNYITSEFTDQDALVLDLTRSIEVAPQAPAGVTVTVLAKTFDTSYAKDNLSLSDQTTEADVAKTETDRVGPLAVVAAADNTQTGGRVVLVGSQNVVVNNYRQLEQVGVVNSGLARQAILWAAGYDGFRDIPPVNIPQPEQAPLFLTEQELSTVNLMVVWVIPFGTLGIGVFIWWLRRERAEVA